MKYKENESRKVKTVQVRRKTGKQSTVGELSNTEQREKEGT